MRAPHPFGCTIKPFGVRCISPNGVSACGRQARSVWLDSLVSGSSTYRVAVLHQGFIPHYRVAFFERLAQDPRVDYVIFHGTPPPSNRGFEASGALRFPNRPMNGRMFTLRGHTVTYHSVWRELTTKYDAVVFGTHLQFPANHLTMGLRRLLRRPYLLWGHGYEQSREIDSGLIPVIKLGARYKRYIGRHAAGYLVYSEGGARMLTAAGVRPSRIAVVPNTIDVAYQQRLHEQARRTDRPSGRIALGIRPDSFLVAFVGRIYPEKRVDLLISAMRNLRHRNPPVEAIVVGTGSELQTYKRPQRRWKVSILRGRCWIKRNWLDSWLFRTPW